MNNLHERERERERVNGAPKRQVYNFFNNSFNKRLFISLTAITAGILIAITIMAFTGPGSNQPPSGDPVFWRVSGSNVYYSGGNVGIGTTAPGEKLEVTGNIKLSGTTPTYKITNAANPTAAQDVATKAYVDARVEYIVYDRWAGAVPYGCPTLPAAYCPDGWSVVQSWAGDCMRTWNDGWADWYIQARQTLCSKN